MRDIRVGSYYVVVCRCLGVGLLCVFASFGSVWLILAVFGRLGWFLVGFASCFSPAAQASFAFLLGFGLFCWVWFFLFAKL